MNFNFDQALENVLKHEGGYVNHPADRGGETNFGITKRTAESFKSVWSEHNWNGAMRTIPLTLVRHIYKTSYWDRCKCDALYAIHPLLADHFFDLGVNAGTGTPVKHLQIALNALNNKQVDYADVAVDGAIGQGTLRSLQAFVRKRGNAGIRALIVSLLSLQYNHYLRIVQNNESQEVFMNGWANRLASKSKVYHRYMDETGL